MTTSDPEMLLSMFETFFHSSPAPCAIVDRTSRFLQFNVAWQQVLGYSAAELGGMQLVDLIHIDDLAVVYSLFRDDAQTNCRANRYRHRNGSWVWMVCSTSPLPGADAFSVYMTDVTPLMQARENLNQRDDLLRQMEMLANVGAWEGTLETDEITWTDNLFRLYDLPVGVAPYHDFSLGSFDFDDGQRLSRAIGECRQHGTPWNLRLHMTTSGGKQRWVRSVGALGLRDGRPYSIYGAMQDITEQVQLEQDLMRYTNTLSGLQAISSDQRLDVGAKLEALLQLGCDALQLPLGVINRVEQGGCEILAMCSQQKLVDRGDRIALEGTYTEAVIKHGAVLACHDVAHSELALLPSYQLLGFEAYVGAPVIIDGQIVGVLSFASVAAARAPFHARELQLIELVAQSASHEIARQNTEIALRKLKDDAEAANRAKTQFLTQMSHELRTPLNSIIGYTGRVLKKLADTLEPRYVDALQTVERNGEHLLGLITDLLDIASIEEGKLQLNRCQLSPVDIVQQVMAELRGAVVAKQLQFYFDDTTDGCTISADPVRLRQIIFNLLSNAIKYTERGHIEIIVSVDAHSDRLEIAVRDTGIGISRSNMTKLFRKFERLHDAGNSGLTPGAGLGLALVWDLVAMHGGTTRAESEEGVGSCFRVKLPIHQIVI